MKKSIKKLLIKLTKSDFLWKLLKPISTTGIILYKGRQSYERRKTNIGLEHQNLFESLCVLRGPFKSMKYPELGSDRRTIYPKLLGTYESELQETFNRLKSNNYSEIINVGCGEGYYAIGMALAFKKSTIFAYDINSRARRLCRQIAELNNVTERVKIGAEFTPEMLGQFSFSNKGLIICDCEGFENELFNSYNIENIKTCDLIIELHDFIDINTSSNLKELLKDTHQIESIYSTDDIQKALACNVPELKALSLNEKKRLLRERRPAIMEWIVCISKEIEIEINE